MHDTFFDDLEEEISFGTTSSPSSEAKKEPSSRSIERQTPPSRASEQKKPHVSQSEGNNPIKKHLSDDRERPSSILGALPEGKHIFLPNQASRSTRVVAISSYDAGNPCFLYRHGDDLLLVGSGIQSPTPDMYGIKSAFPDIRFLLPLKGKIRGIILPEFNPESAPYLRTLLQHLDFPSVYAPESALQSLRGSLQGGKVELVPLSRADIRIGGFQLRPVFSGSGVSALRLQTETTTILQLFSKESRIDASENFDLVLANGEFSKLGSRAQAVAYPDTKKASEGTLTLQAGSIIDIDENGESSLHSIHLHLDTLLVDGNGMGALSSHIIKAREQMMLSGAVVMVFTVDKASRTILGPIRLETRGLAYLHEAREAHRFIIKSGRASYEQTILDIPDIEEKDLVKIIKKDVEKELAYRLDRTPMIIPIVISV